MQDIENIAGRDFVIVGQQPWDTEIGSNCKNIAIELAKNNRVLYVNSTLDRITLLRHSADPKVQKRKAVINGSQPGLMNLDTNLWNLYPDVLTESINWMKVRPLFNALNYRNNKLFAAAINRAIHQLGFANFILFNDNDMFRSFYLKELLQPALSIYYSRDFMLAVDYWKYHGEFIEPKLIAKSDLCVANSTYLANYCKKYNSESFYVGQGCDLTLFKPDDIHEIPVDIQAIKAPIIGYVGALQSIRLDIELIQRIASAKQDWQIVLVGPEDEAFEASELHQMPNVHFLGSKPPNLLAAYISAFDVCLNPQLVNQVTIGNYPRKIDEYLAMGKPVVATATEAMSIFAGHTYLAEGVDSYLAQIETAIIDNNDDKRKERIAFAATHTWENNVKEIYKAINRIAVT